MTRVIHWDSSGQSTAVPADPTELYVEAHVPASGGWTVHPADVADDGSFRIEGLDPHGHYWLRVTDGRSATDRFVWTDATTLDLSSDVAGRDGIAIAQSTATRVVFQASGLASWDPSDQTDFAIGNLGYGSSGVGTYYASNTPQPGDTSMAVTFNWDQFPMSDSARGDQAFMTQSRWITTDGGISFTGVVKAMEPAPFTITDGQTVNVDATFTDPPAFDYPLYWSRSAFLAFRTAAHPTLADVPYSGFYVHAELDGAAHGELLNYPPRIIDNVLLADDHSDLAMVVPAKNPFPASSVVSRFESVYPVSVSMPSLPDASPGTVYASVVVVTPELASASSPVVPVVSPPANLQLDGKDLYTPQPHVGHAPTLSWSAPTTGAPTAYEITLADLKLQAREGFISISPEERATLLVPGDVTSVPFPEDLLADGEGYALIVRAVVQPGQDIRHAPFRKSTPVAHADTVSSGFEP